jgi:Flp pilus assembly protein TadD
VTFGFVLALAAVAFVGLLGNTSASRSEAAAAAGNWHAAAVNAHRAIRWEPWSSIGWKDLAVAQLGLGQTVPARESLHRAIAKDPRDWSLWLALGAASRGRARDAALAHVRELNPLSPELEQLRSEISPQ